MLRLIILAALIAIAVKFFLGRWPWEYLAGDSTRRQAADRARQLLGVPQGASHAEIMEAHRRLIAMVHPDRGGTSEQVHEANAARDLLLGELPRQK